MPWDEGLVNSLVYDAPDPQRGAGSSVTPGRSARRWTSRWPPIPRSSCSARALTIQVGMFGTTKGLHVRNIGRDRVFDTPLSEEGDDGCCPQGAAMNGMRPIYMHNRAGLHPAGDEPTQSPTPPSFISWTTARRRCRWSSGAAIGRGLGLWRAALAGHPGFAAWCAGPQDRHAAHLSTRRDYCSPPSPMTIRSSSSSIAGS